MPTPADIAVPLGGDDTYDLRAILKEVAAGLPSERADLDEARRVELYYEGKSEGFIPLQSNEDALSWLQRPKRISFITRQAVDKLTLHLYKPGPRSRTVGSDPQANAWYQRTLADIHPNAVMTDADAYATLHGVSAIQAYATGDPARPVGVHLRTKEETVVWTCPDRPREPTAVCTVECFGKKRRYRVWTRTAYYTFWADRDAWGFSVGGWGQAVYDPDSSGVHPYGRIPFCLISHELPTRSIKDVCGLGYLLAKINQALNVDLSNLALWCHLYARPLGMVFGVGPNWQPRVLPGGFVRFESTVRDTESNPVVPHAEYLQSDLQIEALQGWIRSSANSALAEIGVPLTVAFQANSDGGTTARSGISIAAQDADLIAYCKGRQPLFDIHESNLASLILAIGASPPAMQGSLAPALLAASKDPQLRVLWSETTIDMPGTERDTADQWELDNGLSDAITLRMTRRGMTEAEAIEDLKTVERRKALAAQIASEAVAAYPPAEPALPDAADDPEDEGLPAPGLPPPTVVPPGGGEITVSQVTVFPPQTPIPVLPPQGSLIREL